MKLEGTDSAKILLRIMAFIEEKRDLRGVNVPAKTGGETIVKFLDHDRKWLGIITVPLVHLIIQGPLGVGMTKEGRAHLAYMRAPWCVFAAFGDLALGSKRINKRRVS